MNVSNKKICEDAPTREFLRDLKKYREAQGYTREELAQRIGVSPLTLRDYERQASIPVLVNLLKLAEVLNYDISHSLNYKYFHRKITPAKLRIQMHERGITPPQLSRRTGYPLCMVHDVLKDTPKLSLQCFGAIQQVLSERPQKPLCEPQAEKPFTSSLLRRMRRESGLSQQKIAFQTGISRTTIGHYEQGVSTPNNKRWLILYELLKREKTIRQKCSFKKGQSYRIYTKRCLGSPESKSMRYEFMYEGKRGEHYVFREKTGGWTRTYTEPQLIGKVIQEV